MGKPRRTASAIEKQHKARLERCLARPELGTDGGSHKHNDQATERAIASWLAEHEPKRLPPPRIFRARR